MSKVSPVEFSQQVRREIKRISWPTRREAMMTTVMVFVMVTVMSIFLFLADQVIAWLIRLMLGLVG
ncbi:MAG: preprotein translocase subunit SecE [Alphaproteobacteria bacterium]